MTRSTQIILAVLPYALTVALLLTMVQPKLTESGQLGEQIKTRTAQLNQLKTKIKAREKLLATQKQLSAELAELRQALPREPEVDLLLLDMEKMNENAGSDFVGLELPEENFKKKGSANFVDSLIAEVEDRIPEGPMKDKAKLVKKPPPKPKQKPDGNKDEKENELGLKRLIRRVFVSGKYESLNLFLKQMKAYKRVVGVKELIVAQPADEDKEVIKTLASDKGKELDLSKPIMTFLMEIYYLP